MFCSYVVVHVVELAHKQTKARQDTTITAASVAKHAKKKQGPALSGLHLFWPGSETRTSYTGGL